MANKIVMIDDIQFEFIKIPAMEALKLGTKVSNLIGPLLGKMNVDITGLLKGGVDLKKIENDGELIIKIVNVFGNYLAEIKESDLTSLCKEFAKYTLVLDESGNNKPLINAINFEQVFAGNFVLMIKWMIHFIRNNFLNFGNG